MGWMNIVLWKLTHVSFTSPCLDVSIYSILYLHSHLQVFIVGAGQAFQCHEETCTLSSKWSVTSADVVLKKWSNSNDTLHERHLTNILISQMNNQQLALDTTFSTCLHYENIDDICICASRGCSPKTSISGRSITLTDTFWLQNFVEKQNPDLLWHQSTSAFLPSTRNKKTNISFLQKL